MASQYPAVKNHASGYTFYISLVSQASTKSMQGNPTLAAGDFKIAIDDGAPANLATLPVVDADFTKRVKMVLSQAETNGDNLTIICADASGAEWCDLTINIQTVPRRFDDLAFPATSGRSMVVDAAGLVDANVVKLGPTGSGTAQTARDVGGNVDVVLSTRATPAEVNTEVDAALDTAIPGSPTADSVNERLKAMDDKLPSSAYLKGSGDADGGMDTADKADVNAEVVDCLNVDTYAEPGQEAPAATNTLVKKIGYLFKFLRNRISTIATTIKVYADDGTTVDQKSTISDDLTTFERGEFGTGP